MNDVIVLDSTPLGMLCHPGRPPHVIACRNWLDGLLAARRTVILPEIADYEVRRELLRIRNAVSIRVLESLMLSLTYLPLTTAAMRRAADLWAQARQAGRATASGQALVGDVILAAQALTLGVPVVVATGNPAHLARYVGAELWSSVTA